METLELAVRFDEGNLDRFLGYPCPRTSSPGVARRVAELRPGALERIHPRGAFRLLPLEPDAPAGFPEKGNLVGLGLCTLGPELEELILESTDRGDFLAALVLDALGSAAAEALAEDLEELMQREARSMGLHGSARISPGYGDWAIVNQAVLVELLPATELGIRLTAKGMMEPRKSVSFGVAFREGPVSRPASKHRCERCSLQGCTFRRHSNPAAIKETWRGGLPQRRRPGRAAGT